MNTIDKNEYNLNGDEWTKMPRNGPRLMAKFDRSYISRISQAHSLIDHTRQVDILLMMHDIVTNPSLSALGREK